MLESPVWLVFLMSRNMNLAVLGYNSPIFLNKDLCIEAFSLWRQLCVTQTKADAQLPCFIKKGSSYGRGHLGLVIVISFRDVLYKPTWKESREG